MLVRQGNQRMLVNAEGLPIESIDRIELTLNPMLTPFINWEKIYSLPKYLKIRYCNYYGPHYYLDMQAQFIYQYSDVKLSIAAATSSLIENGFIDSFCPRAILRKFIFLNIGSFVVEIREIEFAFDFQPEAIQVLYPEKLLHCYETLYSTDRRTHDNKPARKSVLEDYDRTLYLKQNNQIPRRKIENNPYSQRIEFRLTKNNSPYRTIKNISGSYADIIKRYIPYLAILYHNHFGENILVNCENHPCFGEIYTLAQEDRSRYTGNLERMVSHYPSDKELRFFNWWYRTKMRKTGNSPEKLAMLALQDS